MTEIKLTRNDNDKTVEAKVGEPVVIELPENPTTGYRWILDVKEETGIASTSDSIYAKATESGVGSAGTRTFIVKLESSGSATVNARLRRQWEPENTAIDEFKAVIKAR